MTAYLLGPYDQEHARLSETSCYNRADHMSDLSVTQHTQSYTDKSFHTPTFNTFFFLSVRCENNIAYTLPDLPQME